MTVRVGINGFGRIGRNFFRAALAAGSRHRGRRRQRPHGQQDAGAPAEVRLDPRSPGHRGHLRRATRSASTASSFKALAERDPAALPWGDLGADIVIESTGIFTDATKARAHVDGGAKKVIISAPATNEDVTVVMGVNDDDYDAAKHTRHLQRLVHDELPGADGEGAQRRVRHRSGPDDDDPRLHRRPEPAGRPAQGPAPRPRRRPQHGADLDRRGQGHRRWCCPSSRASSTATRCACRCRPARPPTSPSPPAARPPSRRSTRASRRPPTAR